jgi:predicted dehydrogenase
VTGLLGVGVLGCGDVARSTYLVGLKDLEERGALRLAAICDSEPTRLASAAAAYPDATPYPDYDQMLADPQVSVVVNLTPMQAHTACTLKALEAGKHVYTEKPIATSVEDATAIIESARAKGAKLACAPVLLLHPDIRRAANWVRKGALGKVSLARARGSHGGPARLYDFTTDPTWFYQEGGGPLFDLGVYPIHVLCTLLGPARRVSAFAGIADPELTVRSGVAKGKKVAAETPDNFTLMLDFGDATFAMVDAAYTVLSAKGPRMELYGDKGVLNLYSRGDEPPAELYVDDPETGVRGWLQHEESYRGSLTPYMAWDDRQRWTFAEGVRHLVECVADDSEPLIGGELARHMLEIMEASTESARSGRVVELQTTFALPEGWHD